MPLPIIAVSKAISGATGKKGPNIPGGLSTIYAAGVVVLVLIGMLVTAGISSFTSGIITNYSGFMGNTCDISDKSLTSDGAAGNNSFNSDKQKKYAQAIIDAVAERNLPENAAVIALATVAQETGFQMYWNPHVPGSQDLADGGPEGGRDLAPPRVSYSVGLYQQQVNGTMFKWGTVQDAMDPKKSTNMFLDELMTIPNWTSLPITVAAQRVQRSAFPDAYAKWEAQSRSMVATMKPTSGSYGPADGSGDTGNANKPGTVPGSTVPNCAELEGSDGKIGYGTGSGRGDDYLYSGGPINAVDPWGYFTRQCVSFVAWRMNQQMGWKEGQPYPFSGSTVGLLGNAETWGPRLAAKGYKIDMNPAPGAIAWWGGNKGIANTAYGHVAVVTKVNDNGTVEIEQYNGDPPFGYSTMTLPVDNVSGYIHVADLK